ncbi:MAG TPA: cohesin domain-containing protein [Candidatus Dormibacteraeota bacterium]|nr:cohesin domain-containing protein [Candidatus Dormibacteraeota bacterium]
MRRIAYLPILAITAMILAGCPKSNKDFAAGKKAQELQDYDTALADYQRALRANPSNTEYKLNELQMRFEDGQYHLEQGRKDVAAGQLQMALAEFQRAATVDPSNAAAEQEAKKTLELMAARTAEATPKNAVPNTPSLDSQLLAAPPELKPLSREPINFRATEDARTVFETIGKLAGLSVLFDPDFVSRRISVELPGVTLEQALDAVSLESKAFWKPLTSTVIFVAPDNPQKRRDLEDEEVRTFYLSNTLTPQDLTEVVTGLRQLLDLRRVTQVNSDNAIVVRDTPDKLILAAKIIHDIDQARPEVLLHFQVLSASLDHLRDLGVLPGQSATIAFTPLTTNQPSSSSSSSSSTSGTTTPGQITLGNLKNISLNDYSATLPGATATAILTDSQTHIIQDPQIRVTDGEKASLKIGQRVPIATGSFQAGVGVGVGGGAGVVNPLVNTQFQYIDVGVNIDVTPRVHPNGDVSLTLSLDVSSVVSQASIGGIEQPVIGQNKIGPDQIRLRPGEVSILGGLFQTTNSKNVNGIPGLAKLPFFKYLFSDNRTETQTSDILIVITPHVLRMPDITSADLRPLAAGTDTNVRVFYKDEEPQDGGTSALAPSTSAAPAPTQTPSPAAAQNPAAQLQFNPSSVTIKPGARVNLALNVSNVKDLYSIPLLIHYNPAVIQVEDVTNGGFLSGGTQEIAVVQRIDAQHGDVIVSATRQPNTPGVNGSGTLLGLVVRGVAPGTSPIQILQVNGRNAQQQPIPMVSGEATIHVQ